MLTKQAVKNSRDGCTAYRWFYNDSALAEQACIGEWLSTDMSLQAWAEANKATGQDLIDPGEIRSICSPVDADTEVWAAGVTYLRSREARMEESETADIYDKVYAAERAEIFFKSVGWRVCGTEQPIRIRRDSEWNVPEPEVALVMNAKGRIVGYTAGNDVSSRDIEGANPLYLPQAKVYDGACAIGPAIVAVTEPSELEQIAISIDIERGGRTIFAADTSTGKMKRSMPELADWLYREISFPRGSMLMTGTGIVPADDFTLQVGDRVAINVGLLSLINEVQS
jgi:2-dehydro-3-deoxy-D-arabinonate dehydratase